MKHRWLLGLCGVAVIGALVGWWLYTFELIPTQVDLPPRGEARYNALFALRKTLEAQHVAVVSHASLSLRSMALQPGDTLVLNADVRTLDPGQVDDLLDWLDDGGHLIFALPHALGGRGGELLDVFGLKVIAYASCTRFDSLPPTPEATAASGTTASSAAPNASAPPPVELETEDDNVDDPSAADHPAKKSPTYLAGRSDPEQFCSGLRFKIDSKQESGFSWLWGSPRHGYVLGRHGHGKGDWFVATNLEFLTNRRLQHEVNARLTWQVLGPALVGGTVHLVYAANVLPWYVVIVRYGWPVLVPLLLALLAWLWARSQRLGPVLPSAPTHRRALLEHIQATGDFVFRRGREPALYQAARRSFIERLRRRDPALALLRDQALLDALAQRYQFEPAALRLALEPADLSRPAAFLKTIQTLFAMRARL